MSKIREDERKSIIERLSISKTIYGEAAKYVKGNKDQEEQFLIEFYEELNIISFQKIYELKLMEDVIKYYLMYHKKA